MPRFATALSRTTVLQPRLPRLVPLTCTRLSTSSSQSNPDKTQKSAQDSLPSWEGRHPRDHAVNRPALDPQAESAKQGMKDHDAGKEGSDALSRKDERNSNQRAKEEHPKAPEPVIGMNDERGSKGH